MDVPNLTCTRRVWTIILSRVTSNTKTFLLIFVFAECAAVLVPVCMADGIQLLESYVAMQLVMIMYQ